VAAGARRMAVVGVGLNVLPLASPAAGLASGYGCLAEIDHGATAPGTLARVAEPLLRALLAFEHAGFSPVAERFARRDLLRGQTVTTTLAAVPSGLCEGIDGRGGLLVRDAAALHVVSSGEVSIRPLDPVDRSRSAPIPTALRPGGPPC
jgi:BirA family biotin operon repressor/biotin-[acetyl-CoA-carboxylase] ligase